MPPENTENKIGGTTPAQPIAPHKIVFNAPPQPTVTQSPDMTASSHAADTTKTPSFRSYNYDIQSTVKDKGASLAQIVMAEARKQETTHQTIADVKEQEESSSIIKITLITIGIIAILGGGAVLAYTLLKTKPVEKVITDVSFDQLIKTEKIVALELPDLYKSTALRKIRDELITNVPINSLVDLQLQQVNDTEKNPVSVKTFLDIFESRIPESLDISLRPEYALGIHGLVDNSPYIILITNDYDNAYVGMLEWEKTMLGDIGNIFFEPNNLAKATSTDDISKIGFQDKVLFNKDTRVVYDKDGKTAFLWSIVNRNIIIITTNGDTLQEIVKRMTISNITR